MTRDEILQERKWLMKKIHMGLPSYESRLIEYNRQVELFNKDINRRAREATKTLKVGDIVYLPDRFNRKGLWRVDKIMVKNVLLVPVGESDFRGRIKCSAEMLIKVKEEDESLVNALDDIGLI
jgi:hypothetical protein